MPTFRRAPLVGLKPAVLVRSGGIDSPNAAPTASGKPWLLNAGSRLVKLERDHLNRIRVQRLETMHGAGGVIDDRRCRGGVTQRAHLSAKQDKHEIVFVNMGRITRLGRQVYRFDH